MRSAVPLAAFGSTRARRRQADRRLPYPTKNSGKCSDRQLEQAGPEADCSVPRDGGPDSCEPLLTEEKNGGSSQFAQRTLDGVFSPSASAARPKFSVATPPSAKAAELRRFRWGPIDLAGRLLGLRSLFGRRFSKAHDLCHTVRPPKNLRLQRSGTGHHGLGLEFLSDERCR